MDGQKKKLLTCSSESMEMWDGYGSTLVKSSRVLSSCRGRPCSACAWQVSASSATACTRALYNVIAPADSKDEILTPSAIGDWAGGNERFYDSFERTSVDWEFVLHHPSTGLLRTVCVSFA